MASGIIYSAEKSEISYYFTGLTRRTVHDDAVFIKERYQALIKVNSSYFFKSIEQKSKSYSQKGFNEHKCQK